jgi:hypothetical protein
MDSEQKFQGFIIGADEKGASSEVSSFHHLSRVPLRVGQLTALSSTSYPMSWDLLNKYSITTAGPYLRTFYTQRGSANVINMILSLICQIQLCPDVSGSE